LQSRHMISKIVATAVSMAVVILSVIQFHHHGCDGRAYFSINGVIDLSLSGCSDGMMHMCEYDIHHHSHEHHSHSDGSGGDSDCGIHQPDFCGDEHSVDFGLFAAVIYNEIFSYVDSGSHSRNVFCVHVDLCPGWHTLLSYRGPPSMFRH
ncbi:MAG: hypothetical protein K2M98_07825, partial [Muribaculum sp.]|nr:hypothetical protein [Muribaculum sp.]